MAACDTNTGLSAGRGVCCGKKKWRKCSGHGQPGPEKGEAKYVEICLPNVIAGVSPADLDGEVERPGETRRFNNRIPLCRKTHGPREDC